MDPITLAAIGTVVASSGVATSLYGMGKSSEAQKAITQEQNRQAELSRQAERIRMNQAKLIFENSQRNILRQSQAAQAMAISRAEQSGAMTSSAYQGAIGGILGQQGSQLGSLRGNYALGQELGGVNLQISESQQALVNAQGQLQKAQSTQDFGRSLFGLGTSIAGSSVQGSQVLNTLFSPPGSDKGINSWDATITTS